MVRRIQIEGLEIELGANKRKAGKSMRDCIRLNLELPKGNTLLTVKNLIHYS